MKSLTTLRQASGLLGILMLFTMPASGQSLNPPADTEDATYPADFELYDDDIAMEPEERGARYARIRYFEGGISLLRENDETGSDTWVEVNAPLIPGDEIWTGEDGRIEIQTADGSHLRLDASSRLAILNLADREGTFDSTTLVRLLNGSLYVRTETLDPRERRFQIDTPAGTVFLLSAGVFRVDVNGSGVTTLASYRGVGEMLSDEVSVIAHSGERLAVAPGRAPGEARAFNTLRRDSFDLWSDARDDTLASAGSGRGAAPDVPEPVRPYVRELDDYGDWIHDPGYGWIWRPDDQEDDWRPYYYGRWVYAPVGMVWAGYEPWGWAPYHYGRWHFTTGLGWFWAPGYVYSGAFVTWAIGPSYYSWAPIGYYGYPVLYHSHVPWVSVHHSHVYYRQVHRHYGSWSHRARDAYDDRVFLRRHPPVNPRQDPVRAGSSAYRRALKDPGRIQKLEAPRDDGLSFRHRELPKYRRLVAAGGSRKGDGAVIRTAPVRGTVVRATPAAGRRTEPATRSKPSRSADPGLRPPSGQVRSTPRARVSPVTGKPVSKPVQATPSRAYSSKPVIRTAPGSGSTSHVPKATTRTAPRPGPQVDRPGTPRSVNPRSRPAPSRYISPNYPRRTSPARPYPRVRTRSGSYDGGRGAVMKPSAPSRSSRSPVIRRSAPAPKQPVAKAPARSSKTSSSSSKGAKKGAKR